MTTFRKRAWLAFLKAFGYDTRPTEFFSICFLVWWAVLLSSTETTFATSPGLRYLAAIGSQNSWSFVFLGLALTHVASLIFNMFQLRRLCCLIISLFWMVVAYMIFLANPVSVGTGICIIVATSTAWVSWRGPHNEHIVYLDVDDKGNLTKQAV